MKKLNGNLTNRIEEGRNYNEDKLIHVGDDITMYHYSDRTCYYVTEVIDQNNIKVSKYNVVANKEKACGMGHQEWLYMKDSKVVREWKLYRNNWCEVVRWTKEKLEEIKKEDYCRYAMITCKLSERELNKIEDGKEVCHYSKLSNISFGVRDYYFDWEF